MRSLTTHFRFYDGVVLQQFCRRKFLTCVMKKMSKGILKLEMYTSTKFDMKFDMKIILEFSIFTGSLNYLQFQAHLNMKILFNLIEYV